MNWAKEKNILIVIFLILNIVLAYMNYQKNSSIYTLTSQQESNIKKLLYENNIMLYTLLPKQYPPMRKLILAPVIFSEDEIDQIIKTFFNTNDGISIYIEKIEPDIIQTVYKKDGKTIGFSDGRISYSEELNFKEQVIYSKEDAKKLADNFLKKMDYNLSDLKVDFMEEEKGVYRFLYYETYKDSYIYNSYIEILIRAEGIEYADIYKMKPVKYTEFSRSIYAPDEILFGFMNQFKKIEDNKSIIVIQKIDIGYLIESDKRTDSGWEAIPYYRITLADGRSFFLNAYTSKMSFENAKIQF